MTNRSLFLNSLGNKMFYFVAHVKHAENKLTLDGQTEHQADGRRIQVFNYSKISFANRHLLGFKHAPTAVCQEITQIQAHLFFQVIPYIKS